MWRKSLKILDTTETESFEEKSFQSDRKIIQKYCRADLGSVSEPLTCWLSISVLTQGFLGIKVTTLFAVYNFVNTSAIRHNFFSKCSKFDLNFKNPEKYSENVFNFRDNCLWIVHIKHSLLPRENTCHWETIC